MRIVVIGSNFAGLSAALEIKERLGANHRVIVISKDDQFVFMPSLIWLPFGLRTRKDITFPLMPIYAEKGIEYHNAPVTKIDLEGRKVFTPRSEHSYDYLVIASGPKADYSAVPGLGPKDGFTQSIFSLEEAEQAGRAFERLLERPGPVVVGAVQGASFFGAAYEFLFNIAHQVKRHRIADKVPLVFLTPEPFVGHLGVGGMHGATKLAERLFGKFDVMVETNTEVREILPDIIHLENGHSFPFAYAMLAPPFKGIDAVRACTEIVDEDGFVEVDDHYRTEAYPEVFAAGVAVSIAPPEETPVPCGVPKTGYLSEKMASVVAQNVVASIEGTELLALPPSEIDSKYALDAGDTGVVMSSESYLEPGEGALQIPGPEAHWAKVAFEKYFLATRKRGLG